MFTIYSQTLADDRCFISSLIQLDRKVIGVRLVSFHSDVESSFVVLPLQPEPTSVENHDLLVPFQVSKLLGYCNGIDYSVEFIAFEDTVWNRPHNVNLEYKGYVKTKHWDESTYTDMLSGIGSIVVEWPEKLRIQALQNMASILLADQILQHKATIVLKVMDIYMVRHYQLQVQMNNM